MICPRCMKQRSIWGSHCPHCTHEVDMDEQLEFSLGLFGLKVAAGVSILALLILVDNL